MDNKTLAKEIDDEESGPASPPPPEGGGGVMEAEGPDVGEQASAEVTVMASFWPLAQWLPIVQM